VGGKIRSALSVLTTPRTARHRQLRHDGLMTIPENETPVSTPVIQQWPLPGRAAQIVSMRRPGVELAKHFVHGVDDRLRLIQLNMVT
jgi:hypothetical protein